MSANLCVSCGVSIPAGQRVCSACYGDPDYGRDGILRRQMEEDFERQQFEAASGTDEEAHNG